MAPHSRYTEACREDILNNKQLKVFADSQEAGIYIVIGQDGKHIFVMGHPEYDRMTLDAEYKRDLSKGLDIQMPVMNGLEATKIIRESNTEIPIIMQTAYAFSSDKENAMNAGATEVLVKPITLGILRTTLSKYLPDLQW